MARPGRPERSRTALSSRQLRRFQRGITLGRGFPNADRENTRRTVIREKLPITCALFRTVHSTGRTEPDRCTKAPEGFLPPADFLGEVYFAKYLILLVGAAGFEPTTCSTQNCRATRLRYTPMVFRNDVDTRFSRGQQD